MKSWKCQVSSPSATGIPRNAREGQSECSITVHAGKKLVRDARAPLSSQVILLIGFGIARAIKDLCIQITEFVVAKACHMSHLGKNRIKTEI